MLGGRALPPSTAFAAEPAPVASAARTCGTGSAPLDIVWRGIEVPDALEAAVCDWFRDEPWRVRFARAVGSSDGAAADVPAAPAAAAAASASGAAGSGAVGPAAPPRALRIDVQLEAPAHARLHVQAGGGQNWTHDVELPGPLDAAGVEVIAQTLHSVAQAAVERAATGRPAPPHAQPAPATRQPSSTNDAAPQPATSSTPPASPEPASSVAASNTSDTGADAALAPTPGGQRGHATAPHRSGPSLPVHTGLGYLGFVRGDEPFLHGPTLRIALDAWRRLPSVGAFFRGTLFTSSEQQRAGLALRSSGVSLSAGASLSALLISAAPAFEVHAALGGGVDLIALDTAVTDPARLRLAPERRTRPRPFLEADAGLAWRRGPIELELSVLLRWQLLHTTYQIGDADSGPATIIEPWRLQPGAALTLAYVW